MEKLWNKEVERKFFSESLHFATPEQLFYGFDDFSELKDYFEVLLSEERNFFSSMKSRRELGRIIEIAGREETYEKKAEVFLKLIKEG